MIRIKFRDIGHVTAYQFFQMARLASVILISIFLVKSGLERNQVSRYEWFIFSANLLSFFWVMGLKNAALSYYPSLNSKAAASFFFNFFLILQTLGLVFSLGLFLVNRSGLLSIQFSGYELGLLAAYLFLYAPTVIPEIYFIIHKQSGSLIRYGIIVHLIQITAVGGALLAGGEVRQLFAVLTAWMALRWGFTLYVLARTTHFRVATRQIGTFLFFALPLILHILLGNGMEYVDGLLVQRFFEPDLFAVFRYGARELPFILILISALSSTLIPVAVQNGLLAATELKKHTTRLMHLFFPGAILLLFLSPFLYRFFYSAEYEASARLFNIYLLIIVSRILLVEVFVYARHQNRLLMYVSGAELLVNLGLSLLLLRFFGLEGIAAATVIAFMLSKAFLLWYTHTKYQIRLSSYLNTRIYTIYSLAIYTACLLSFLI